MSFVRKSLVGLTIGASLLLTACGDKGGSGSGTGAGVSAEALPKVAAPEGKAWNEVVATTDTGFLMGNPDAPLKIIEFASPSCSHCAQFSIESAEQLKSDFVASGRVSLEVRPFMLGPQDVLLTSLIACNGKDQFFPLLQNVFASQHDMMAGFQGADQTAVNAASNLPPEQRYQALAKSLGLVDFFTARGLTADQINQCLAKPDDVTKWVDATQTNQAEFNVTGTPTFILNGENIGTVTWEQLRTRLQEAGAR